MVSHNSPPIGETSSLKIEDHLGTTGLAVEYFPHYSNEKDEFHTHEFVEFLFVLSGTFRHVTGDYTYDESAGGMAIINYNQFHRFEISDGSFEMMNLYWSPERYPEPELPEPLSGRLHELIPAHPSLGHRINRIVRLQLDDPDETSRILHRLLKEQTEMKPGYEAAIDALFRQLMIEICRAASIISKGNTETFNFRMEKIRLHLEKHYTEPVRLEQLCELSGLKETNLCQQFKKYTGLTIGNYLKQRRLATAMQQLRSTSNKIMAICHDCGFPDLPHFNTTFRKAIGETPSSYRKRFCHAKSR